MLEPVPMASSSQLESVPIIDRVRARSRERSGAKHWPGLLWMLLCSHCHPRTHSQPQPLDAHCSVMMIGKPRQTACLNWQVKARLQPDISSRDLGSRSGSFAAEQAGRSALQRHMACLTESEVSRCRSLWKLLASREVILAFEMRKRNDLRGTRHRGHPVDPS